MDSGHVCWTLALLSRSSRIGASLPNGAISQTKFRVTQKENASRRQETEQNKMRVLPLKFMIRLKSLLQQSSADAHIDDYYNYILYSKQGTKLKQHVINKIENYVYNVQPQVNCHLQ